MDKGLLGYCPQDNNPIKQGETTMSNINYSYSTSEEVLMNLETAEEVKEFMEAYEIGGFDLDDRYSENEYDYWDTDNYGYDD